MRQNKTGSYVLGKTLTGVIVLTFLSLLVAGCSDEGEATATEPVEPSVEETIIDTSEETTKEGAEAEFSNEEAISAVVSKMFTAPDEAFIELERKMFDFQSAQGEMGEEEYQEFLESPEYEAYISYIENKYADYFTADEFEDFLNSGMHPWYALNNLDGDFKATPKRVEVEQSENPNAEKNYNFAAVVEYTNPEGVTEEYTVEGMAIMPEEGQIGKFTFTDGGGFMEQVQQDNNK